MHNAAMCTLSLYNVIGITRNLHIKLKSFSNIAQSLHKEALRGCSLLYIIAKKSVIMSEAFLVDVSMFKVSEYLWYTYACISLYETIYWALKYLPVLTLNMPVDNFVACQ